MLVSMLEHTQWLAVLALFAKTLFVSQTPFLTEKRIERINTVVQNRTKSVLPIVEVSSCEYT